MRGIATDRQIKSAANKSYNFCEMMRHLGYASSHPGGNTMRRFKKVMGELAYGEIASRKRWKTAKTRWVKVPMNKR